MPATASVSSTCHFQICFRGVMLPGRSAAFPCDDCGNVDMDQLSEACRRDYLFARIMTRWDRPIPEVVQLCGNELAVG
jgi:hypothetical protein